MPEGLFSSWGIKLCLFINFPILEDVWSIDTSSTAGWSYSPRNVNWSPGIYFTFTALGGYGYVLGGYINPSSSSNDEFAIREMQKYDININYWMPVASYPHYIYNHCTCADEETGRLYSSGGIHKNGNYTDYRQEVYYYQVGVVDYNKPIL